MNPAPLSTKRNERLFFTSMVVFVPVLFSAMYLATMDIEDNNEAIAIMVATGFGCSVLYLATAYLWSRRYVRRRLLYTLEQARDEDARQILDEVSQGGPAERIVRRVAELVRRQLGEELMGSTANKRFCLTVALNAHMDAVSEPGWRDPARPLPYPYARLIVAGICQVAIDEGILAARSRCNR